MSNVVSNFDMKGFVVLMAGPYRLISTSCRVDIKLVVVLSSMITKNSMQQNSNIAFLLLKLLDI